MAQDLVFYERKEEGWFWYKGKSPKNQRKNPKSPNQSLWQKRSLHSLSLLLRFRAAQKCSQRNGSGKTYPSTKDLAWNNPTVENVRTFLYLQRFAIDRSEQFSDATELAVVR